MLLIQPLRQKTAALTWRRAVQAWRLAWAMITYKETMESLNFEAAPIWDEGLRQLEWVARYLQKAHYRVRCLAHCERM